MFKNRLATHPLVPAGAAADPGRLRLDVAGEERADRLVGVQVGGTGHQGDVIHNYRWRLGLTEGERRYDRYEDKLATAPTITVPTITINPERDPFTTPGNVSGYPDKFTGKYEHRTLPDIGHNVPQEAPTAFAQAVIDVDHL